MSRAKRDRERPDEACRNCGDPTPGAFCPRCGQRKVDVHVGLGVLLRDLFEDQFGLERRTPATLEALFLRPGKLTREYLQGRVVRYIPPFKLYLVSSILLFLLVGLVSAQGLSSLDRMVREAEEAERTEAVAAGAEGREEAGRGWHEEIQVNTGHPRVDALLQARMERLGRLEPMDALREVVRAFVGYVPTLMFLLLPVFAAILRVLYLRGPWFYAEHFVFVLHTHAFLFGLFTLILGARALGLGFVPPLLLLWAAIYVYLAMRRVYGQGHGITAIKYWTLGWMYFWVLAFTTPLVLLLTLLLSG